MRNCGKRNFKTNREIKVSDERVTSKAYENMYEILKFPEKFDNPDKMETTSSESKVKMDRSGKGLVTALSLKTKARSIKYKKARYAIGNVNMKDLSKKKSKSLKKLLRYLIWKRHPNMNPL